MATHPDSLAVDTRGNRYAPLSLIALALMFQVVLLVEIGYGQLDDVPVWFIISVESFDSFGGVCIVYLSIELCRIQRVRYPLIVALAFALTSVVSVLVVVGASEGSLTSQLMRLSSLDLAHLFRLGQYALVVPLTYLPFAVAKGEPRYHSYRRALLVLTSVFAAVAGFLLALDVFTELSGNLRWFSFSLAALCFLSAFSSYRWYRLVGNKLLLGAAILVAMIGLGQLAPVLSIPPNWFWPYFNRLMRMDGYVIFGLILVGEYIRGYESSLVTSQRATRELERKVEYLKMLTESNQQMHEQLRLAGLRLDAIIDAMPEGVFIAEAPSGKLILSNKTANSIMGSPPLKDVPIEERPRVMGLFKPNGEMFTPEELPTFRSIHRGEVCSGVVIDVISPSSAMTTILVNSAPIEDAQGNVIGAVIVFQDVTRQKQVERMKDDFLSLVSHDLKTPLTTIKGYASTLLQEDVNWSAEEQRRFLRVIAQEADRLTRRVQDLLDSSSIASGNLRINKGWCNIRDLIEVTVERLRDSLDGRALELEIDDELPPIPVDAARFKQVLTNLLENAVKFSRQDGTINIRTWLADESILVSVADDGVGIEPADVPHIFDRFSPVQGPVRAASGKGLGLAICHGIVEAHKGAIWVDSVPEKGATFIFSLPVLDGELASEE